MSVGAVGGGYGSYASYSSPSSTTVSDASSSIAGIIQDATQAQGEMALKLIQASVEGAMIADKMSIAQQIIDVYA